MKNIKQNFIWLLAGLMLIGLLSLSSMSFAKEGKWIKKTDMPTQRNRLSTAVVNGKIYAIGGHDGVNVLSTVEVYEPVMDAWTEKSPMPTPRSDLSTSVVDGKIYAIGGADNVKVLSIVEEYDTTTDTWIKKANMPTSRAGLSTSQVTGKIYAIGGLQAVGWVFLSTVEEYDTTTDRWTKKADMPTKRNYLSTSVVSGKIYAIGGFITWRNSGKALSVVEVYDPTTDTWTKGAEMPTPRWVPATNALKGKIYAIGGTSIIQGKWTTVSEVEVYNPATDRWTKGAEMPTRRGWHAASAVNGKIYVIGGASRCIPGEQPTGILSTVEEFDAGYAVNAQDKLPTLWGKIKRSK